MINGINIDNAFSFLQLADSIGQQDLKDYIIHWIGMHYREWEVKTKSLELNEGDTKLTILISNARYPPVDYEQKLLSYQKELAEWERKAEEIRKTTKTDGCCVQ